MKSYSPKELFGLGRTHARTYVESLIPKDEPFKKSRNPLDSSNFKHIGEMESLIHEISDDQLLIYHGSYKKELTRISKGNDIRAYAAQTILNKNLLNIVEKHLKARGKLN